MQLFSADATMFLKKLKIFFCPQKVEKTTLKSCSEKLKSTFFFLLPWAAQTTQTEEFMFQNVAYRPTVYRTGAVGHPTFSNCVKSLLKICYFAVIQFVASVAFESWKPMFLFPATKWYRIFHFLHFYACTTLKLHSILLKVLSLGEHHVAKAPTYILDEFLTPP